MGGVLEFTQGEVTRHEHWRLPWGTLPPPGARCDIPGCGARFSLPESVLCAADHLAEHDDRTPAEIYDDVRTYCELAALWVAVADYRRGLPTGMSPQEATNERARIVTHYRARNPRRFSLYG